MSAPSAPAPSAPAPAGHRTMVVLCLALVGVGGMLCLFALDRGEVADLAPGYLLGFVFCWTVALGSLFFVALQHATRSVWSVGLRRVAELLAAPMGVLALLFVPLLAWCVTHPEQSVFPWMDHARVAADHALEQKAPYLDATFFLVRTGAFFVIWAGFAAFYVGQSLRQDGGEGGEAATRRMRAAAPVFLILFAFTATFAAFDWLMSLEPHWFSTVFGTYVFAGMVVTALAAIAATAVTLRGAGRIPEDVLGRDHLYSLGALLFAFTCFWGYIAFSQYMLVWYGNLPEETVYFVKRMRGGWEGVTLLLALLRFLLPFLLLLPRSAKSDPGRLLAAAGVVLVGQFVDLYWMIVPATHGPAPRFGPAEVGPPLVLFGVLGLVLAAFLRRHRAVAVGDPLLEKARRFHL